MDDILIMYNNFNILSIFYKLLQIDTLPTV